MSLMVRAWKSPMDTTLKNKAEAILGEPLLDEPVRPESWECCGSECGDACIQTMYWAEKARYDAQQRKLKKQVGWTEKMRQRPSEKDLVE